MYPSLTHFPFLPYPPSPEDIKQKTKTETLLDDHLTMTGFLCQSLLSLMPVELSCLLQSCHTCNLLHVSSLSHTCLFVVVVTLETVVCHNEHLKHVFKRKLVMYLHIF